MNNSNPIATKPRRKFEELEGLRGICAIAVLVNHLIYRADNTTGGFGLLPILGSFAHLAVLIFFVLSGFVIGYTTVDEFTFERARIYIIKRLIRLYPIYIVSLIFSFLVAENFDIVTFLYHLAFMQTFLVNVIDTNGALWSLHYEFLFYILFLFIWKFKLRLSIAIYFCIVSSLLTLSFNFHFLKVIAYFTLWLIGLWIAKNREFLAQTSKSIKPSYFWTPIILVAAFNWANAFEIITIVDRLKDPGGLPSVFSDIIVSGIVGSIVAATLGYKIPGYKASFILAMIGTIIAVIYSLKQGIFLSLINYQLAAFFLALIPLTFFFHKIPLKLLSNISVLGSISYALYVIHTPIQCVIYNIMGSKEGIHYWLPNYWQSNLVVIIVVIPLAFLLEHYIQPKVAARLKVLAGIN